MTGILDSMMAKPQRFFPESVAGYVALQLAKRLDDTENVWGYFSLLERHALPTILEAFARAQASGLAGNDSITAFEKLLLAITDKEDGDAI